MRESVLQREARNVLIVQRGGALDGSSFSGLLLADGLREAGWSTHVAFGVEGPIIEQYATSGHETHVVPHNNWLRRSRTHQFAKDVWLEWGAADAFERLIDEVHPDAVYLNTVVSFAGAVAARRTGMPCVWHLREMFTDVGGEIYAPNWAIPLVRRAVSRLADRLVANSEATARNLLGPCAEDVFVVPNAVRSAFFEENRTQAEAQSAVGLVPDGPIIGVPGTLRPMKGHPFFLSAVAPVLREREELQVAVTGAGTDDFSRGLKKQVRELDIENQVRFLGWVEDMPAFYRACDLVCIPSRAEPFGRTAIEAFAVGTPVVATAVGGLQEIVTDGETGLLVSYGDDADLVRSLRRLLAGPDLRKTIRGRAHREAEKKYHERIYKKRIGSLVMDVVSHGDCMSRP